MQSGGGDAAGDRGTETAGIEDTAAKTDAATEGGGAADEGVPGVGTSKRATAPPPPPASTPEIAGHYVLDVRALEKRLAILRRTHPPKRAPGRKPGLMRELARMIESGFELEVRADHHYTLKLRARADRPAALPGTWAREGGIIVFRPTAPPADKPPRVFRARPVPAGLLLLRGGQEVLLKRR